MIMVQKNILFLLFLLSGLFLKAQNKYASEIDSVYQVISGKHVQPFGYISKEKWKEQLDELKQKNWSAEQTNLALIGILQEINDEHTILFPKENYILPFRGRILKEGFIITVTSSELTTLNLGKLLAINGQKAESIFSSISRRIKQDNPWYVLSMSEFYFHNTVVLTGMGILHTDSLNSIQVQKWNGDTIHANFRLFPNKPETKINWTYADVVRKMLPYRKSANYWYEYIDTSQTLYFNYEKCNEDPNHKFSSFNKELFHCVKVKKPKKIILDLRSNPGGNSALIEPFVKSISKSYLNHPDHFIVLVGRKVISSSLMNAVELKQKTKATFIGEPSGGNLYHHGEIQRIYLPQLNAFFMYSTNTFQLDEQEKGSFLPGVLINYTWKDVVEGNDPALAAAFAK